MKIQYIIEHIYPKSINDKETKEIICKKIARIMKNNENK